MPIYKLSTRSNYLTILLKKQYTPSSMDISYFLKEGNLQNIQLGLTVKAYGNQFGEIHKDDRHYYDQNDLDFGFSYFKIWYGANVR